MSAAFGVPCGSVNWYPVEVRSLGRYRSVALIPEWYFHLSVGLFGLLFGSLANVIIWRVPRGESIVSPGSHCPSCGREIRWFDNVPVLSWLVLRARCRDCGSRISVRYPVVEVISGLLWLLAALLWGMTFRTAFGIALFYLLLVLTYIDLDHLRLPNPIVATLAGVGLVGTVASQLTGRPILPLFEGAGLLASPAAYAAVGVLIGLGVSALMAGSYALIRKTAGLGMGDIKLLAVLGIFYGPYVLMVLLFGSIIGSVIGGVLMIGKKDSGEPARVPFGPFLAIASLVVAAWGPAIWAWYMGIARLG
jgi:leader peptidase (prepilin peptidase)/N-methyltransferase